LIIRRLLLTSIERRRGVTGSFHPFGQFRPQTIQSLNKQILCPASKRQPADITRCAKGYKCECGIAHALSIFKFPQKLFEQRVARSQKSSVRSHIILAGLSSIQDYYCPMKGQYLFRITKGVKDKSLCRDDNYIRFVKISGFKHTEKARVAVFLKRRL